MADLKASSARGRGSSTKDLRRRQQDRVTEQIEEQSLDRDILASQVLGGLQVITDQITAEPPRARERLLSDLSQHCADVIDATAVFLSHMTKDTVSLSAKFLWMRSASEIPVVHTVFRSTHTKPVREGYEPTDYFTYSENTAFRELVENWGEKRFFASDNLFQLAQQGKYQNSNRRWRSYYAAAAVTPIPSAQDSKKNIVGFLCADSLSAELDNDRVIAILEIVSEHINEVLSSLIAHTYPDKSKEEISQVVGWKHSDSGLMPVNEHCQETFQEAIADLEWMYKSRSALAPVYSGSLASALEEEFMRGRNIGGSSYLHELARSQGTPAAKAWLAGHSRPPVSDEQANEILRRMAEYNPAARDIIRNAH